MRTSQSFRAAAQVLVQTLAAISFAVAAPMILSVVAVTPAIAGPALHTCAIMAGGGLKCWGWNNSGQLGDGTTTQRTVPADVTSLANSGLLEVTTNVDHTCALTTTGGVKCWGSNNAGQLGNGSTIDSSTPVDVTFVPPTTIKQISAGGGFTCALTAVGGVKCWGSNGSGQLGNGGIVNSGIPMDVSGLTSGVAQISAGGTHACALLASGGLRCWGLNAGGQLGNGSTTNSNIPVNVNGLGSGVAQIRAGGSQSCALTTAGGVKCWGINNNGQLGDNSTTQRNSPVDVTGLTGGVSQISPGGLHTCALTTAGGIKCWGFNGNDQLGNGTTTNSSLPVDVTGLTTGVAQIAAGQAHTCVLMTAGPMKCWGFNGNGQLGNGTTADSSSAVDVSGLSSGVAALPESVLSNQTITFLALANRTYGDAPFNVTATASSGLPVSFTAIGPCTVSGSQVTITSAGTCSIIAIQPGNTIWAAAAPVQQGFGIAKATPVITWNNPFDIQVGTPLDSTQLNAVATFSGGNVLGTFNYTPTAGALLGVGNNQQLKLDFTPSNSSNFNKPPLKVVFINVLPPAPTTVLTALSITPINAGLVNSQVVIVNNSAGEQTDPHINGNLASYTDFSPGLGRIGYFDFLSNTNAFVPVPPNNEDTLSDVDGTRIVFSRASSDKNAVFLFDTATASLTEIDPQPGSQRSSTAIGGSRVAFLDSSVGNGDVLVHDLNTNTTTNLSTSPENDFIPNVAPDGNTVVWQSCGLVSAICSIRAGVWQTSVNTWNVFTVSDDVGNEQNPDSDGTWIVYDGFPFSMGSHQNIYFQPLIPDGIERRLATIAGDQRNPSIDKGVIAFESRQTPLAATDLFVYVMENNLLYQVTSTPGIEESLNGISILPNGDIRVVWAANDGVGQSDNIYATTFTPSRVSQTINFSPLMFQVYGALPFTVSATASSDLAVSFSASGPCTVAGTLVTITGAGSCAITASQAGDTAFLAAPDVHQSFTVLRGIPVIHWNSPADITSGTPLSSTQLNATATFNGSNISGAFDYAPSIGAILPVGNNQQLTLTFTPFDTANINTAIALAFINVIDVPPFVQSIVRGNANPTHAGSVVWKVVFSENVTGVDVADFSLVTGGVSGASISSVTGSGTVFIVTSTTGSGSGSLALKLSDNDSIRDSGNNPLGGSGTGNGDFNGETYTIDRDAPDTTITAEPPNPSKVNIADFGFKSSEANSTFECQLDAGSFTVCIGPQRYTGLANGDHTFNVRAIDAAGNVDTSPASYSWTVAVPTIVSVTPIDAGLIPSPIVVINNGAGDQKDPHVRGNLASYTDFSNSNGSGKIEYFDFLSGTNTVVPSGLGNSDFSSSMDGTRIVFIRSISSNGIPIQLTVLLYDTANFSFTEIDPQSFSNRPAAGIGGQTVVYDDFTSSGGEILVHDLDGNTATNISSSPDDQDANPNIAPDGKTVVWSACGIADGQCRIMEARLIPNCVPSRCLPDIWKVSTVEETPGYTSRYPDTDGTWVVYGSDKPSLTGGDIYFQPVISDGVERRLALAGEQFFPRIDQGVIAFEERLTAASDTDLFVYVMATNQLYRVTSTPGIEESFNDVSVLANGDIRLVWSADDGPGGESNVYATTFTPAAALSVDSISKQEGDSGTTEFTFTVSLSPSRMGTVTVDYQSADGTATIADGDYLRTTGTLTFGPNDTSKPIKVLVNGDTTLEDDETFSVELSNPQGALISVLHGTGTGTILNDDNNLPLISIDDVAKPEGNSGTSPFVFTVTLSSASADPITVDYATADRTATVADGDYVAKGGTLNFAPNVTSQQITILVNGDTRVEANEFFTVELSNPINARLSPTNKIGGGIILNDDASPPVAQTIVRAGANPTNANSVSWTVTFSNNVAGVDASDFSLAASGVSGASISNVTGSANLYTVTANTGTGSGTLGLSLVDNDSIRDIANNPLGGVGAGNGNLIGETYAIDKATPDTTITANPSNPSNNINPSFQFTSSKPNSTFQCQLDNFGFGFCISPAAYNYILDGSHTFQVRAVDALGNIDPSPASYTWTADTVPPDTSITSAPKTTGTVTMDTATLQFISTEPNSSFDCSLNGAAFTACQSGITYTGLANGNYFFQVRARDAAGNVDPMPANTAWTVVANNLGKCKSPINPKCNP